MISRLWTWLHSSDPRTWIGHGLQGFFWGVVIDIVGASMWLALAIVAYHFGVRETEGIVEAYLDKHRHALVDGVMDLISPFVGLGVYVFINQV